MQLATKRKWFLFMYFVCLTLAGIYVVMFFNKITHEDWLGAIISVGFVVALVWVAGMYAKLINATSEEIKKIPF